ncbi:hypothetical protein AB0878_46290 [Amycolatopsis sp. NPDC047767]|uniref:glycine-rich domain-containing protein n=1 Tax=Amycolatopsis sp. NPDC047767 TaxID=3156765 RepID=UPI0034541CF2
MTAVVTERATGRSLVSDKLFATLTRRVVAEDHLDHQLAERIVDQALAFLAACADNNGGSLAPSEQVDLGWHAFVLHTRDYARFCDEVAGRFIHHVPTEPDDPDASGGTAHAVLSRTVAAIESAGFAVDDDLWSCGPTGTCTGCHNGCHNDPPPPPR